MANNGDISKIVKNLEIIKKLLILGLIRGEKKVTSEDIGASLGLDSSTVRHMISIGEKAKK